MGAELNWFCTAVRWRMEKFDRNKEKRHETIAQLYEGVQDRKHPGASFKMLEASFELFVPLVVASMIDVGIGGRDTGYVSLMGGFLVLLE